MHTDHRHGLMQVASYDDLIKAVLNPPTINTKKIDEELAPEIARDGFVFSQLDEIAESVNLAAEAAIHDAANRQGGAVAPAHTPADDGRVPVPRGGARSPPPEPPPPTPAPAHPPLMVESRLLTTLCLKTLGMTH
jgi:hypothetical protein